MAVARSIKMYVTIFVATTCIYMVLYQYHVSQQMLQQSDFIKNKDISADADVAAIARKYNSFLWSPMSLFSARQPQQQEQPQDEEAQQSISERQSNAARQIVSEQNASELANTTAAAALPLPPSPLQATTHIYNTSNSSSSLSSSTSSSILTLAVANKSTAAVTPSRLSSISRAPRQQFITQNDIAGDISQNHAQLASADLNNSATTSQNAPAASHSSKAALLNSNVVSSQSPAAGTVDKGTNPLPTPPPPPLYIITPTYKRAEQLAELTRLGYTLKHVPNLLWLVIEDANQTSPLVIRTLNRIGVPFEYFLAPMPEQYKQTKKAKPRGVSNRNRGLEYLRANATSGVFYFADDDNTYDISIFEQMRYTTKVSMWPVGLVTKFGVSTPIIRDGKITGFYDGWIGGRKFPVDMAGFAVSVKFLHERPDAKMPFKPGYEEDGFLKSLAPLNITDIELLADDCTEILTWHTQTKKNANATLVNMTMYGDTNLARLNTFLVRA